MLGFIARRLVSSIFVLLGVTLISFLLSNIISDPVTAIYGNKIPPKQRAVIKQQLGLNDPLVVQYGRYVLNVARGDLGRSYRTNTPVLESLMIAFPSTLALALAGLFVELLIGIPAGIVAAVRRGSWLDRLLQMFTLFGLSSPTVWLGLVLLYVFAFLLKWFPLGGSTQLASIVLPAITIGLGGSVFYARLLRTQMLEEMSSTGSAVISSGRKPMK